LTGGAVGGGVGAGEVVTGGGVDTGELVVGGVVGATTTGSRVTVTVTVSGLVTVPVPPLGLLGVLAGGFLDTGVLGEMC
jgi:hypothetical protein